MLQEIPIQVHHPRASSSARQELMPRRYSVAVQLFSIAAFEEGVFFRMERAPMQVLGGETVTGVRFSTPDGGQETLDCDVVIFAVGQVNRPQAWMTRLGIETDQRGVIVVADDGRTSNPKVYAGGDNTLGPDLVVTAVAAGRRAAGGMLDSCRLSRRSKEAVTAMFSSQQNPGNRPPVAATLVQ